MAIMLGSFSLQASELKVGYVQVDKILKEAPQTAETGKKLENEFSPRSVEIKKMQKEVAVVERDLEKEGSKLSDSERRSKQRQASSLRVEVNRKQRELREDINIRKNEELSILQDRINAAVKTVSEAGGYDIVMYGGVAYASNKKIGRAHV